MLDKLLSGGGGLGNEMQNEMMNDALEALLPSILPKLKPFIGPGFDKLKEELGDDEKMFLLRRDKESGAIVFYIIEIDSIKTFELTKTPKIVFPITDPAVFLEKLITGNLSELKA